MTFKLGKREPKIDRRNMMLRSFLPVELPKPPAQYDVDIDNQDIWPLPLPLFANDRWGCCVISGRANQTLRFERIEQGVAVPISDNDVLSEYWVEQGDPTGQERPDNGLYVLDSLKQWRSPGWMAGGHRFNIYAFAQVDFRDHDEVKHAIYLLSGLGVGVTLPKKALDQINAKEIWMVEDGPDRIAGGHYMWVIAYTRTGPVFLTWGQRQQCTWEWWDRYVDECYAIIDDKDKFLPDSPLDVEKLQAILQAITV